MRFMKNGGREQLQNSKVETLVSFSVVMFARANKFYVCSTKHDSDGEQQNAPLI